MERYSLIYTEMYSSTQLYGKYVTNTCEGHVGENDDEDIKETIMDPNTRSLIRLNISDMENDMRIFQMLRGTSPSDASARKSLMSNYTIPLELIDT